MILTGHRAPINTIQFSPKSGDYLASGSNDKSILLWKTFPDCQNIARMTQGSSKKSGVDGNKQPAGAILDLKWSADECRLYSTGSDGIISKWDVSTCRRTMKFDEHTDIVHQIAIARPENAIDAVSPFISASSDTFSSVGDDGCIFMWDSRSKKPTLKVHEFGYPVTSIEIDSSANFLYSGSLDNQIYSWDLVSMHKASVANTDPTAPTQKFSAHTDTITHITLSGDSKYLLATSMDSTLSLWDVQRIPASALTLSKPVSEIEPRRRLLGILNGAYHGVDKMLIKSCFGKSGKYVCSGSGSGDRGVVIWELDKPKMAKGGVGSGMEDQSIGSVKYKLPGHLGSVNQTHWHPTQNVLASCSNDQRIILGEIS